ncbi:hypothetical protein NE556_23930 [[Clostridium] symbiosum]|nr:hypothetical protein [[Clostridium] symbiosum]MCQ4838189.1 hypothetical protein [[Clostridium] symbiosum]
MIVLTPVIYIVNHLSFFVLKLFRVDPKLSGRPNTGLASVNT